jgi:hypothetical protein
MTRKVVFPLMLAVVAIGILRPVRADQPLPQGPPVTIISANPTVAAPELPPPAGKPLRHKWFHWSKNVPPQPTCPGCGSLDPDFACSTCEREWIFLFGSCRAFYGERPHRPVDGYFPYP